MDIPSRNNTSTFPSVIDHPSSTMSNNHLSMPMSAADQHAANAEEHLANGLFIPALEEHRKAAETYSAAESRSSDESAKRTLRLLYNKHSKAVKELDWKIAKLIEEGKDPSVPQKAEIPQSFTPNEAFGGISRPAPSPPPQRLMTESQNTGDESFMLLGGQGSDPGDAFNQFWTIMQGLLDNLSQPVAFATVPLGEADQCAKTKTPPPSVPKDLSLSSDADFADEPLFSRFSKRIGINLSASGKVVKTSNINKSPQGVQDEFDEELFDEVLGDDLTGSFFVIPSKGDPSVESLRKENESLKRENEAMRKQVAQSELALQQRKEQDVRLRDSIFQATREAQRAMGGSLMVQRPAALDCSNLNINGPTNAISETPMKREFQYIRRLKEVEEELRLLRAENEKNKAMIVKFRERWEKLKDSAKRKKEAKAAAEAAHKAESERITEEQELEEEMDDRRPLARLQILE